MANEQKKYDDDIMDSDKGGSTLASVLTRQDLFVIVFEGKPQLPNGYEAYDSNAHNPFLGV